MTSNADPSTSKLLLDLLSQTERRLAELQGQLSQVQLRLAAAENVSRISVSMLRRSSPQLQREFDALRIEPHPDTPAAERAYAEAMAAAVRRLLADAGPVDRGPAPPVD